MVCKLIPAGLVVLGGCLAPGLAAPHQPPASRSPGPAAGPEVSLVIPRPQQAYVSDWNALPPGARP
ncbi:MAG: hypothetical protein KGR26_12360, partial [Cyanobacteria bacterium REEB65]|nr:hypothetical protein [Cyanobacteria bacterium REEB65]